jgi:lysozyme
VTAPRVINDAGRAIVMAHESLRLEAYTCPAGKWTIGYGHTGDVKPGDRITAHQAEAVLDVDLMRFEMAVEQLAPGANANQFSALVSFAFNVGIEALEESALLKKFNAGAPLAAAAEFAKWVHAGGQVLPGLVKRRAAEAALFLTVPS